jgi:uncharacterized protein YihD (DUF1040 family)
MKAAGLIVVTALASISFAQDFTNLAAYKNSPAVQEAERKAAAVKAVIELPQPAGDPSEKLNVNEFLMKLADYSGKIVELTFDKVVSLKQIGSSGYVASVTYERGDQGDNASNAAVEIVIPPQGLNIFKDLYEKGTIGQRTVIVQVIIESKVRALGTRYRRDDPAGKRYSW